MLTGKQKRQLRSLAHHLTPIFQIGKSGITDEMVLGIEDALEKRELLKISILQNCEEDKKFLANSIAKKTKAHLVQLIGHTIVLYKQSSKIKNRKIELVK